MNSAIKAKPLNGTLIAEKYKIIEHLGAGGMATVYKANHVGLNKQVALKILNPMLALAKEERERFLKEGEIASRISHPHIVDVTDVGMDGEHCYLVMELLTGRSLYEYVQSKTRLTVERTVDIFLPILSALHAMHLEGVIHRDLKPDNIFLSKTPSGIVPKLIDFGISKSLLHNPGQTFTPSLLGTPYFIAPEVMMDKSKASPSSDVYSMGISMFECVAGTLPYHELGDLNRLIADIKKGELKTLESLGVDVPSGFSAIVKKSYALDPSNRYPNAKALGEALLPFASAGSQDLWNRSYRNNQSSVFPDMPATWENDVSMIGGMFPPSDLGHSINRLKEPTPPNLDLSLRPTTNSVPQTSMAPVKQNNTTASSKSKLVSLLSLALLATVALSGYLLLKPEARSNHLRLNTLPNDASIHLNGTEIGRGTTNLKLHLNGAQQLLEVKKPGYTTERISFKAHPPFDITVVLRKK